MTLFCNYGTGEVEEAYFPTPVELAAHISTFTFDSAGSHSVTCRLSNSRGEKTAVIIAEVDEPITGVEISVGHALINDPASIAAVYSGTRATIFIDYGDGTSESKTCAIPADCAPPIEHTYADIGVRNVTIQISNSVSCNTFYRTVATDTAITGLDVTFTNFKNVSDSVDFTRTLSAGSHVTCDYDFADGFLTQTNHDDPSSVAPEVVNHLYNTPGNFSASVKCYNYNGCLTFNITVTINMAITGVSLSTPKDVFMTNELFSFAAHADTGFPINRVLNKGNGDADLLRYFDNFTAWSEACDESIDVTYSAPGYYTATLTLSNDLPSPVSATAIFEVLDVVSGPSLTSNVTAVPSGGSVAFTAAIIEGSVASSYVNPGDGGSTVVLTHGTYDPPVAATGSAVYAMAGNYTPSMISNNSVSSESFVMPDEVIVQDVVTTPTVQAETPLLLPAVGTVQGSISVSLAASATDPSIEFSFSDGITETDFVSNLYTGGFTKYHTYDQTMIGTRNINVRVFNLVSSVVASDSFDVIWEITNPSLQLVQSGTAPGSTAQFRVSSATGSHGLLTVDFGDGTEPEKFPHPDQANSTGEYIISHIYGVALNYTPSAIYSNNVSSVTVPNPPVAVVQGRIPQLSLASNSPIMMPTGLVELDVAFLNPGDPEADCVHFNVDCVDGTTQYAFAAKFLPGTLFRISYNLAAGTSGTVSCTVNASNLVNSEVETIDVIAVVAIQGLSVSTPSPIIPVGSAAVIAGNITDGGDVTFEFEFGDGTTVNEHIGDAKSFVVQHTYPNQGYFVVGLTANNPVSTQVVPENEKQQITVLYPLTPADIVLEFQGYTIVGGTNTGAISIVAGQPEPANVTVSVNPGTADQNDVAVSWNNSLTIPSQDTPGDVSVILRFTSPLPGQSPVDLTASFVAMEPISGASLSTPNGLYAETGQAFPASITFVTGSHVRGTLQFVKEDGTNETVTLPMQPLAKNCTLMHILSSPGKYTTIMSAENNVTDNVVTVTGSITVENSVAGVEIDLDPVKIPDGQGVLIIDSMLELPPTNAWIEYDDSGGAPQSQNLTFSGPTAEVIVKYPSPGVYTQSFTVKNHISEKNFIVQADVQGEIQHLTATGKMSVEGDIDQGPDNSIQTSIGAKVTYTATIEHGTNVIYKWDFGNGDVLTQETNSILYAYSMPGTYSIIVTASNNVSSLSVTRNVLVTDSGMGFESVKYMTNIYQDEELEVLIVMIEPKDSICLSYLFEGMHEIKKSWAGTSESACSYDTSFNLTKFTTIPQSQKTIVQYFEPFGSEGHYNVTISVIKPNIYSLSGSLTVNPLPCESPGISPKPGKGDSPSNPIEVKKGDVITVLISDFSITLDCRASNNTDIDWNVYSYNSELMTLTQLTDINALKTKVGIDISKGQLHYGHYFVSLNVTMSEGRDEPSNSSGIFIEVVKTPLTLNVNNFKLAGSNQVITMKAVGGDPDTPERTVDEMIYTWYCRRKDEVMPSSPHVVAMSGGSGLGGCFDTGPGILDVKTANFPLNTANMLSSTTYIFEVSVKTGDPEDDRVTSAEIMLEVTEGHPPECDIRCFGDNCMDKVSAQMPYTAEGFVIGDMETSYSWRLRDRLAGQEVLADFTTDFSDDGSVSYFTIPEDVLLPGNEYDLELTAKVPGETEGKAKIVLRVDRPPVGGNCTVKPIDLMALVPCKITCSGWNDDQELFIPLPKTIDDLTDGSNAPGLEITYEQVIGEQVLLFYTDEPYLAVGKESNSYITEVRVTFKDRYGSFTIFSMKVRIKPQVSSGEQAISLEDQLNSVDTNDPEQALSFISAMAEMMDLSSDETDGSGSGTSDGSGSSGGTGSTSGGTSGSGGDSEIIQSTSYPMPVPMSAEEAEYLKAEQERAKQQELGLLLFTLSNVMAPSPADAKDMPVTALLSTAGTLAQVSSHMTSAASEEMTEDTMRLCESMSDNLDRLGEHQKEEVINNIMGAYSNTMGTMDKVDDEVEEPDPDIPPPSDDLLDKMEEAELEKKNAEISLKKKAVSGMDKVCRGIAKAMINTAKPDGEPVKVGNGEFELQLARISDPTKMKARKFHAPGTDVKVPSFLSSGRKRREAGQEGGGAAFQVRYTAKNPYSWDESSKEVNSGQINLALTDLNSGENLDFPAMEEDLEVDIDQPGAAENYADLTNATVFEDSNLMMLSIPVEQSGDAYLLDLLILPEAKTKRTPEGGLLVDTIKASNISFIVYVNVNTTEAVAQPNETHHDLVFEMTWNKDEIGDLVWHLMIPPEHTRPPGFNMAFKPKSKVGSNYHMNMTDNDLAMRSALSRCRSFDSVTGKWDGESCKVAPGSTVIRSACKCNKLTKGVSTFAGGVTMPKVNTIDFKNVFKNFASLLKGNPTVFAVVFSIWGIYALVAIWARRMDKKDVERWGVTPLLDNRSSHTYYFKVSVYTGLRQGAGTRSNVCFVLSGETADSGVRILADNQMKNKPYERGTVRHFVMTTQETLGELTFLRIWHDNSGKAAKASWFLDKVIVEDLQTKVRYFFLCGRWLAVDEDDGQVNRILPVAGQEEVTGFQHLFFTTARKNLTDEHLWISILSRPTKSSFTRLQRLTCCLTLLFTTMVANAMWYKSDESSDGQNQVIRVGPIVFSVQTLLVSIFGNLTVIPINIIIVNFFRKSRPKNYLDLEEMEEKQKIANGEATPKKRKWYRRKYPLPTPFIYVAWTLAILSALASAFFVILYSLEWGKSRSEEWLSALFFSFFQSVMLIQPVKVVIIAMLVSLIFKKLDDEEESKEEIIQPDNAKPKKDEDILDLPIDIDMMNAMTPPKPPSKKSLERAREKREHEKKVTAIIKEVVFYLCFLLLISFIAWGPKDDTVFVMNQHIKGLFDGADGHYKSSSVSDGHKFWEWCRKTVSKVMYFDIWYNGRPTNLRERNYLEDGVSFRVGPARLRQLRVKPASCELNAKTKGLIIECNEAYSMFTEEDRNFTQGWSLDPGNETDRELSKVDLAFKYFGILDLAGLPYMGRRATYGGGGYVADLGTSARLARRMIKKLQEISWVDLYTRAVFLEFTVYNPNINLFAYVNFLMEYPATGGVMPSPRIMSFQVYHAMGGMGTFVLLAEVLYLFILVYFMVHEIIKIYRQRKAYFKDPWNVYEVCLIVCSVCGIAMYGLREVFGRMVMSSLKEDIDSYTNYMQLAYYDEALSYVIGTIVFLANIKFLRLLRFNKHVNHLSTTLSQAGTELFYFGVTFFIVVVAYATLGMTIFGLTLYGFCSFINTLESLMSMMLGKFDFAGMEQSDKILGPIFFVTFVVFVFFIMINMFLGIIGNSFYEVRMNPELGGDDHQVLAFMLDKFKIHLGLQKPVEELGIGYVQPTDALDARLATLDKIISMEYKRSTKSSEYGFDTFASNVMGLDLSDDNDPKAAVRHMKRVFGDKSRDSET